MYYIGVMSGTSCDGVDVVVVDFTEQINCVANAHVAYPKNTRNQILSLLQQPSISLQAFSRLDAELGHLYAQVIQTVLSENRIDAEQIHAIGLHGQTVYHDPEHEFANTIQLGSAPSVAQYTGIPTVANFRQMDIANGGQGAPLAPIFHQTMFAKPDQSVALINLGGIANITWLHHGQVMGFDTGPANCLMDDWIQLHQQIYFDHGGQWAQQGHVKTDLLTSMMTDDYFAKKPPKSTGREYFNLKWLEQHLSQQVISPVDVQRTLLQLTVDSVVQDLTSLATDWDQIIVCGGGAHNRFLLAELGQKLQQPVVSSSDLGMDTDFVEATMMAWLAQQRVTEQRLDLGSITGAKKPLLYGVIHQP